MSSTKQVAPEASVIPIGVDPDDWIAKNVDDDEFPGSTDVLLAFRVAGNKEREHWINYYASLFTRKRCDIFPAGRMCHAEMLLATSEGVYAKNSVTKKVWAGTDANGKDIYKPGCVHCKLTSPAEWKSKYVFLVFQAKRKQIIKALRFCINNNGQPFNSRGFNANLIIPGGLGVREWDEALMRERRPYFCSEFIVTALKAMISDDEKEYPPSHWKSVMRSMNPATSCPNSLYRTMFGATSVHAGIPLGKDLDV
jgi:hypothetical protein